MCGLVGVVAKHAGGFDRPTLDVFHTLLYVDALRGEDSTGVFMVEKEGDVEIIKEASTAASFQEHKFYEDIMKNAYARGRYLIGHNRKATRGTINDENAHPFYVNDKIILVHNGTLWGDHKKLANTEVDSHAIAHVLSENLKDTAEAVKKIQGAYALMWYNAETKEMNFLRNSQRPLFYVETHSAWIWSSESEMLEFALARHKVGMKDKIASLSESMMTTFIQNKSGTLDIINTDVSPLIVTTSGNEDNCGWYGRHLEDYEAPSTRYAREDRQFLKLAAPAQVETNPARKVSTQYYQEEILAEQYKCGSSRKIFAELEGTYNSSVPQLIQMKDFSYTNTKDSTNGYFIYGLLEDDPSLIIRVYVPASTPELDILDWTVNEKYAEASVGMGAFREWTLKNKDEPILNGYVIYYGQQLRILSQAEVNYYNQFIRIYLNTFF